MTLGKKICREGLNVCMNYEFNLLHHVSVVAKRLCAAAETAHKGDDTTPSGPGVKNSLNIQLIHVIDLKTTNDIF